MALTICTEERVGPPSRCVCGRHLRCCQCRPARLAAVRHRGTGCIFDNVLIQPREIAPDMLTRTVALIPHVRQAGDGVQGKNSS